MKSQYKLAERAVLMRLSVGLPGKSRKDRSLTESVKGEHSLGKDAGSWVKQRWPKWALEPIEKLVTEARAYHAAVTLPFDAGIGILPAALIMDHGDRMRQFKGQFDNLITAHFIARYDEMIAWAQKEHNGTFDATDYPSVTEILDSFYFRTEPLPVPDASHFANAMQSLLGVDAESVNIRVQDAMEEAQKELLKRMVEPLRAMVEKLNESPKIDAKTGLPKADIIFRDSLVDNIREIAALVPKLNIGGDPTLDQFAKEMEDLTAPGADAVREDKQTREQVKAKAKTLFDKLSGYTL